MNHALPAALLNTTSYDLVTTEISAAIDVRAIITWVATKRDSKHTRRAFATESRRFLAWLIWAKAGQNHRTWLDKASTLEAAAYAEFLKMDKPPLPLSALQAAGLERQPFSSTPLARASVERAISSLKTMYADLIDMVLEDGLVVERNPFSRFKLRTIIGKSSPREKALNKAELGYVDLALSEMCIHGETALYHQLKWIWTALRWGALRRHELAQAVAGDIRRIKDETGVSRWMLHVVGKGDVYATVPLSDEFMTGFADYRRFHGFPPVPVPTTRGADETPLVLPLRGPVRNMNPESIYRGVKELLGRAALIAGKELDLEAEVNLKSYASHSARHTMVTDIVDATGDITLGQEMARHGSIETTRRYKAKSVSRLASALQKVGGVREE